MLNKKRELGKAPGADPAGDGVVNVGGVDGEAFAAHELVAR